MKLTIKDENGKVTANLAGELDTPATLEIQPRMDELIAMADKDITLDCSKLSYIASAGLRQLILLRKKCLDKGGSLTFKDVCPEVMAIFDATSFSKIFHII